MRKVRSARIAWRPWSRPEGLDQLAAHAYRQAGDSEAVTIGKQARHHPELRPLQKLRDTVAELRLGAFINTVGGRRCSRIAIMPLWTTTGRNQPRRGTRFSAVAAVMDPRPDPAAAGLGHRRARLDQHKRSASGPGSAATRP